MLIPVSKVVVTGERVAVVETTGEASEQIIAVEEVWALRCVKDRLRTETGYKALKKHSL